MLYFQLFFISLIYIENKCLYDAIRDLKRDNFFLAKGRIEHGSIASKDVLVRDLPSEPLKLISYIDSAVLFLVSPIHLDWQISRPVSGESSIPKSMALPQTIPTFSGLPGLSLCFHSDVVLYSNLSLCFRTYFVFKFVIVFSDLLFCCRICHCVFGLILLSNLSLCFRTYFVFKFVIVFSDFVFEFVIVFSDLLFCCRICRCFFWLVILFSNLSLCFLTCDFVFEFVIVFSDLFCCRICHCVFGLILFSNLSLCFLTYCFVVEFVVVFSDLLFCFRICRCVFWLVILALFFLTCYFVFEFVVVFSDFIVFF